MSSVVAIIPLDLAHPGYLAGLLLLPVAGWLALRSIAGLGRGRWVTALGLRCLVIAAFALALAGPAWVRVTDNQTVAFALDQSASIPPAQQAAARQFVEAAVRSMRPGKDRVATISFADRASVDQLPDTTLRSNRLGAGGGDPTRTDIAAALRLSLALFPSDTARRLVLLTDGNGNRGLAERAAADFAALGVPIDVVPLRYSHTAEIVVEQLAAPATASRDEVIELQLIARSQRPATARLRLYRNDRLLAFGASRASEQTLRLSAGPNRFSIPVRLRAAGVHRFRAVLEPLDGTQDVIAVNNVGAALTVVGEATRVALVTDATDDSDPTDALAARQLARALQAGGLEVDIVELADLAADPAALVDMSAVILSNVSALSLGATRQRVLASYVRDQGGGLVVIGGDEAFSVGAYAHTPLETVLPVSTSRDKIRLTSLGMVIVVDRSGSMVGEKLDLAGAAAVAAVELLTARDQLGVVAFDSAPEWVVPLGSAAHRPAIAQRIRTLGGGGGTNMYPALEQAYQALAAVDTNLRHMIVLTDGQSTAGDFAEIAERCRDDQITISTVAVGQGADRALLARIARITGGRAYIADSARPLPQIFARETVLASRSGLYEQRFVPRVRATIDERILRGIDPAAIPPLDGHVVTTPKPTAVVPLVRPTSDGEEPILAYWPVGLGRAVAFTSGWWPKWGAAWVQWPGFSQLWTQALRYAGRAGSSSDLHVEAVLHSDQARITVSAEHLPPWQQRALQIGAQVTTPDYTQVPVTLQPVAPGRFEASFDVEHTGTYLINLPYQFGDAATGRRGITRTGLVQSFSPEYRTLTHDETTLRTLAETTGGRLLHLDHPGAVYEPWSIRPLEVRRPFWEDLLRLALVLFLLDVAVRRIATAPAELVARARRFIVELAGGQPPVEAPATLGALRDVRARAGVTRATGGSVSDPAQAPTQTGMTGTASPPAPTTDALTEALGGAAVERPVVAKPHKRESPATLSQAAYTARLLRAKRRARTGDADKCGD